MFDFDHCGRRDLLKSTGLATVAGSSWLGPLVSQASEPAPRKTSIIMLWLAGGPATIDLWDLKPNHDNGGPFRPQSTTVPGVQICEHLPRLAGEMEALNIVRSMTSPEGDHGRAMHLLRTGYAPQGAIRFPALGAIVAHQRRAADLELPSFVSVTPSTTLAELRNGFLSPRYSPLIVEQYDSGQDVWRIPGLSRPPEVSDQAERERLRLLANLDRRFQAVRPGRVVDALQAASEQAVRTMRPAAHSAFNLEEEPSALRERYGRNRFGQGCLLSRRLVERGVPFVEVTLPGWDTHRNNFEVVRSHAETLDNAFATLIDDLRQRGLLDTTLIVCQGEFGRTPVINRNRGRDHWPAAWSAVMAGGPTGGGKVLGSTSDDGSEVHERPVSVPDLIATVCEIAGIAYREQNVSNVHRPIRVIPVDATPVEELL